MNDEVLNKYFDQKNIFNIAWIYAQQIILFLQCKTISNIFIDIGL